MTQLQLHPLCTLFPRIEGAEFRALVDDIAANGLREPITTHDGMILDGGNRYRACIEAGVAPRFADFTGGNIVSFVLSCNLHRRHMTAGQQAAIVASAQDWASAQPASRPQKAGNVAGLSTVADRAAQSGASERTQRMADTVAKKAPDLARQVGRGEITLPQAARQVATPPPKPAPPRQSAAAPAPEQKPKAKAAAPDPGSNEVEALRAELQEARDNARELADQLQAYMTLDEGQEATAKELARLNALVATLQVQRDEYMEKCNKLIATVKAKDRKIARLEAKANA